MLVWQLVPGLASISFRRNTVLVPTASREVTPAEYTQLLELGVDVKWDRVATTHEGDARRTSQSTVNWHVARPRPSVEGRICINISLTFCRERETKEDKPRDTWDYQHTGTIEPDSKLEDAVLVTIRIKKAVLSKGDRVILK